MLVVGFGDSITEAKYLPIQDHFLYRIGEAFGCKTINSGIAGDTTAKALVRLPRDVLRYRPDVCIFQFGMNDHVMKAPGTPHVRLVEFQNNLRTLADEVRAIRCNPVFCTVHPVIAGNAEQYYYRRHPEAWYRPLSVLGWIDAYNRAIRETAAETGAVLADIALHWQRRLDDGARLTSALRSLENGASDDGVHLTVQGYEWYAECLLEAFRRFPADMEAK